MLTYVLIVWSAELIFFQLTTYYGINRFAVVSHSIQQNVMPNSQNFFQENSVPICHWLGLGTIEILSSVITNATYVALQKYCSR